MGAADSREIDISGHSLDTLVLPPGITDRAGSATQGQVDPMAITKFFARRNRIRELPADLRRFTQLTEISLRDNELDHFPEILCDLKQLTKLSLSFNRIRVIPASVAKLERLQLLTLAGNMIERLPQEIGHLLELRALDLQRNRLRAISGSIGALKHLQTLLLQRNQLELLPLELGQCRSLRQLNIASNQLRFLPQTLCKLALLEELVCSANKLTILPPHIFKDLKKLRNFDGHTNMFQYIPKDIGEARCLQRVNYAINQLKELPEEMGELEKLEWLNINDNQVTHLPTSIGNLQCLKKFGAVQNQLESLPHEIAQMRSLQKLDIRRNKITTFPPTLRFAPSLTSLSVDGNPLSLAEGVIAAQSHLKSTSLMELAARALWSNELRSHLPERVQINAQLHASSAYDCDETKLSERLRTHLDQLDLTYYVRARLLHPKLCHLCLSPFLHEHVVFIDQSTIKSIDDPSFRIPLRYHLCSQKCVHRLQGKLQFLPSELNPAGLWAILHRSRDHPAATTDDPAYSIRSAEWQSTPQSPRALPRFPLPQRTSIHGHAWFAFVTGQFPSSPSTVAVPESTTAHDDGDEPSLRRWLMDRLLGGGTFYTVSGILYSELLVMRPQQSAEGSANMSDETLIHRDRVQPDPIRRELENY